MVRGEGRTAGAARLRHGCPALPTRHCLSHSHRLLLFLLDVQVGHLAAVTRRISKQLLAAFPDAIVCHTHTHTLTRVRVGGGRAGGGRAAAAWEGTHSRG